MLCNECKEREANIHLTVIIADKVTQRDLCEVCGKEYVDFTRGRGGPQCGILSTSPLDLALDEIIAADSRYSKAAYFFLRQALDEAIKEHFGKSRCERPTHISGVRLLEALRELAIGEFGKEAKAKLNSWGVFECEDFGEIVFNLVEAGLLVKQEQDSKADFQGGYDFDSAFPT